MNVMNGTRIVALPLSGVFHPRLLDIHIVAPLTTSFLPLPEGEWSFGAEGVGVSCRPGLDPGSLFFLMRYRVKPGMTFTPPTRRRSATPSASSGQALSRNGLGKSNGAPTIDLCKGLLGEGEKQERSDATLAERQTTSWKKPGKPLGLWKIMENWSSLRACAKICRLTYSLHFIELGREKEKGRHLSALRGNEIEVPLERGLFNKSASYFKGKQAPVFQHTVKGAMIVLAPPERTEL